MKAYVGAPLSLWQDARDCMRRLKNAGFVIDHDWTVGAEAHFKWEPHEDNETIASSCIHACRRAEVGIFLLDYRVTTQGAWCEIGAMLASGARLFVVALAPAAWLNRAAFLHHPLITLMDSQDAACERAETLLQRRLEYLEAVVQQRQDWGTDE